MVIEIAPSNSLQLFSAGLDRLKRIMAFAVGASICAMGISVLTLPGFETEALAVMKALIAVALFVTGVAMMRVGTVRKPVSLAFDRQTEEWKFASGRGKATKFENAAPRGSVLTLNGSDAAMLDDRANPLFDLHLDQPARQTLMSEYHRLQAAV